MTDQSSVRHRSLPRLLRPIVTLELVAGAAGAIPPEPPPSVPLPARTERSQELSVSVGVRGERGRDHAGVSGFLAVALPLERFAAPSAAVPKAPEPPEAETTDEGRPAPKRTPVPAAPLLSAAVLSELCRATVAAALRSLRVPERREDFDGLAARSRSSALLPELRLRAARAQDESLRLTPTSDDPYRFTQDGGDDLVLEARATWKLDRLVFADEEIAIVRLALEHERNAERVSARVVGLVLAWHTALSLARSEDPAARARAEFERLEAEVALEVATNGWFGPHAARLLRAGPGPRERTPAAPPRQPSPGAKAGTAPAPAGSDLVAAVESATCAGPCLPMHVTASRTF